MSGLVTRLVKFQAGHLIISENSPSMFLYILKEGQVKVFKGGMGGKDIPIAIVNSGQYLGELALLSGRNHTASAMALTEVTAVQIPKTSIESQLKTAPEWLAVLTRSLAERLIRTNEVLRRNNIVDEQIMGAFQAAESHAKISRSDGGEGTNF